MQLAKCLSIRVQVGQGLEHLQDELIRVLLLAEIEGEQLVLGQSDRIKQAFDRYSVVTKVFLQYDELDVRSLLLDSDGVVLNETWMADVDQARLHVLDNCY